MPLIFILLLPANALAQDAAKALTLDQALAIAMTQNRDIQSAHAYKDWVEGKYVEERAAALPHLDLTASAARYYDDSMLSLYPKDFQEFFPAKQDTQTAQLGLSQVLFTWGQVGAAIRAAKWGLQTAEDQLRQAQQAARRDVTAAFYDVLLAKELNGIARENLAQKERHRDEAQKKFDLGTATDYDVLAAQVSVENARPEVIRTANTIRTAQERLRFLLADPAPQVDAEGTLDAAPYEPPAYGDAVAVALVNRPELNDLEHQADIAGELVKIAKAGDKPRLDFSAAYARKRYDFPQFDMDTSGKSWNAGIYLSFPVFNGLATKGRVLQARSDQTRLDIQAEKLKDGIGVEVRVALDAVEEAGEIMKALSGTVDQAERLRAMSEKGYEYGVKTRLDVEEAQLYVRQSKGSLAAAKRDFLVAQTNLLWVQGVLGER